MFTEDKITEIFCIADDFCNFFDAQMKKYTFKSDKKRQYHREGRMSKAEVNIFFRFAQGDTSVSAKKE